MSGEAEMVNPEEKSSLQVDCCRPMEKLIVVVGLTVHISFQSRCHVFVAFSVGCQHCTGFCRVKWGIVVLFLLIFGNDIICVFLSLFF